MSILSPNSLALVVANTFFSSPARLHLEGHTLCSLRYLQGGDRRQHAAEDAARFQAWKSCLGVLGIPFLDVVRVLAAVLLLGNVTFADGAGIEVSITRIYWSGCFKLYFLVGGAHLSRFAARFWSETLMGQYVGSQKTK